MTRRLGPFECEITSLGPRGVGMAVAPDGRAVQIRAAPPGARLLVVPTARARSGWTARRLGTIRPPAQAAVPRCAQFGLCGGCALQELELDREGEVGKAEVGTGQGHDRGEADVRPDQAMGALDRRAVDAGRHEPRW